MQIEWTNQSAPEADSGNSTLIRAEGRAAAPNLKDAFLEAAKALGRNLAGQGATPANIEFLTISVPDMAAFQADLTNFDLLYREALGGNSGRVGLIEAPDQVILTAQAVVPPVSDEIVFGGYTRSQLNREYSPRATVPEAPDIMARWRMDGTAHQASRSAELSYGKDPAHGIDLFMPSPPSRGTAPPPLHAYIHGGYWQALDKRDNCQFGIPMVEADIAFAAINYPLCPPATVSEIVIACRAALACLYRCAADFGYDAGRITISGHSAGGHLVGMLAATDWPALDDGLPADLIKGTIAISGLFEVEPLVHTGLNKALGLTVDAAKEVSPILLPALPDGPVIAAVGGAESDEFRRQSRDYVDLLTRNGVDAEYLEMPGLNHFTAVEALADPESNLYKTVVKMAFR